MLRFMLLLQTTANLNFWAILDAVTKLWNKFSINVNNIVSQNLTGLLLRRAFSLLLHCFNHTTLLRHSFLKLNNNNKNLTRCPNTRRKSQDLSLIYVIEEMSLHRSISVDLLLLNHSLQDLKDQMARFLQSLLPLSLLQELFRVGNNKAPVEGYFIRQYLLTYNTDALLGLPEC